VSLLKTKLIQILSIKENKYVNRFFHLYKFFFSFIETMSIQHLAVVFLLLLSIGSIVNAGPAAYAACLAACTAGCSAATFLMGTSACIAMCHATCVPLLAAPTP